MFDIPYLLYLMHVMLRGQNSDPKLYTHSRIWVEGIIWIIRPGIIFCEGKGIFTRLLGDAPKIQIAKGLYLPDYQRQPLIGHAQHVSCILNKPGLSALLKKCHHSIFLVKQF